MIPLALCVLMLVLLMVGIPIGVAIALSSMVVLLAFTDQPPLQLVAQYYNSLDSFALVAVPLFILAGNIMNYGGVSIRLVNLAKSLVGSLPGGLAATCVVTCLIFGALTGSSVGTTFAIGAILIPAMVKQGYPVGFAAALQATAAELAVIIPPSLPMILYGVATGTSIGDMFIAGIGPGLIFALLLAAAVVVWSKLKGYGQSTESVPFGRSMLDAILALFLPVIIMGGIYGGIFTPTEAAVVAVAYATFLAMPLYRAISFKKLWNILRSSTIATSFIMFTFAAAGFFSFLIEISGGGAALAVWIGENFTQAWTFLLAINIFLLLVGTFVEPPVAIIVLGPLLAPIAANLGIDPVHFGLIVIVNLALGMITPPVGVNLFAACAVAKTPLQRLVPFLVPLLGVAIVGLMIITYVPAISIGVVNLLK